MRTSLAIFVALLALAGCSRASCGKGASEPPDSGADAGRAVVEPAAVRDLLAHLEPLRKGGRRSVVYVQPGEAEEQAFFEWVRTVALAAKAGGPPPGGAPAGFALRPLGDLGLWLLVEERPRGGGAFVIRVGQARSVLVEAPHTFFDAGTLPIAVSVFDAQSGRALFINTAHRYIARDGEALDEAQVDDEEKPHKPSPSDVAHAERSFFLAAHRALLEAFPAIATVQLHGFGDRSAPGVSIIVSGAGTIADPSQLAEPLRAALEDEEVRTYPREIRRLGGTSNVQAQWSARVGAPFYHIEICRSLRDRLLASIELRSRFATALSDAAVDPGGPNP